MTINIKAHIRGMKIYSQFIEHKFLFHIVCFSAQINDFHLNISVGGLLSKLGSISLTHRYAILPILFKPIGLLIPNTV